MPGNGFFSCCLRGGNQIMHDVPRHEQGSTMHGGMITRNPTFTVGECIVE